MLLNDRSLTDTRLPIRTPPIKYISGVGGTRLRVTGEVVLFAVLTDANGDQFYVRSRALLVPDMESPILLPENAFIVGCLECGCDSKCDPDDNNAVVKTLTVISPSNRLVTVAFKSDRRAIFPTTLSAVPSDTHHDKFVLDFKVLRGSFSLYPRSPQIEPVDTVYDDPVTFRRLTDTNNRPEPRNFAGERGRKLTGDHAETKSQILKPGNPREGGEAHTALASNAYIARGEATLGRRADAQKGCDILGSDTSLGPSATSSTAMHQISFRRDCDCGEGGRADVDSDKSYNVMELSKADMDAKVNHIVLGHQSPKNVAEALKGKLLVARRSNPISSNFADVLSRIPCTMCVRAKAKARPRNAEKTPRDLKPFEVMHLDVIYPPDSRATSRTATLAKAPFDFFLPADPRRSAKYLLLLVDECTRMAFAVPMEDRSAGSVAKAFRYAENDIRNLQAYVCYKNPEGAAERGYSIERCRDLTRSLVDRVHGDAEMKNAFNRRPLSELTTRDPSTEAIDQGPWIPILESRGVYRRGGAPMLTYADPNEPFINGLAERRHAEIDKNAQTSLLTAGLGEKAYAYAYIHATYCINLGSTDIPVYSPSDTEGEVQTKRRSTPLYEATGIPADLNELPVHAFGAMCFPHLTSPDVTSAKHNPKRAVGIYLHPCAYPQRNMVISEIRKGSAVRQIVGPTTSVDDVGLLNDTVRSRLTTLSNEYYTSSRGSSAAYLDFDQPEGVQHQKAANFFELVERLLADSDKHIDDDKDGGVGPAPDKEDPAPRANGGDVAAQNAVLPTPSPGGGNDHDSGGQGTDGVSDDDNVKGNVTDDESDGKGASEQPIAETSATGATGPEPAGPTRRSSRIAKSANPGPFTAQAHKTRDETPRGSVEGRSVGRTRKHRKGARRARQRDQTASDYLEKVIASTCTPCGSGGIAKKDYAMVVALVAIDDQLLDSDFYSLDSEEGPCDWIEAYCNLGMMLEDGQTCPAYSIRASSDSEARRSDKDVTPAEWQEARWKERTALKKRKVFELAGYIPPGTKVIDTKEVTKVRPDGSVKIRLVARGFLQEHGSNFTRTYSAVASPASIMMLVGIAASKGWKLFTADCANAYLQSDMDEDVFVRLPGEWDTLDDDPDAAAHPKGSKIYRLLKSIYGLKQSGRNWSEFLVEHFRKVGLIQCTHDRCVYYLKDANGKIKLMVATVVDDILVTGLETSFRDIIEKLAKSGVDFDQPSIGEAVSFNGMRIKQEEKHVIKLDQEQYINEMYGSYCARYSDYRLDTAATTPMKRRYEDAFNDPNFKDRAKDMERDKLLSENSVMRAEHEKRYQQLLGALLWPARNTRPEIAFAVGVAGQYAHSPRTVHLRALEHILSYTMNTKDKCIVIDCRESRGRTSMSVFTDADHAGCQDTRKSRSGVVVFMNTAPISWLSRKQTLLTNSTMASETVAAYTGLQKLREPMELLREMGFHVDRPPLFCDNGVVLQHAIDDAPQPGTGTKHLALYTKILREACIRFGDFHPFYVDTAENPADIFTKYTIGKGKDGSEERWRELESRVRGAPSDREWILKLIKAKRRNTNNRTAIAMELTNTLRSPSDYLDKTRWESTATAFRVDASNES